MGRSIFYVIVVLWSVGAVVTGSSDVLTERFPFGDPRNCLLNGGHGFVALPGGGWDNLRNLEMGQVMFANYSTCRMTEDGKYLIPDSTFALPIKSSALDTFAEVFDKWTEYTDMTSRSINAEASFFSVISGSYSSSREEVKKHQYNDKSITTRIQLRRHLYTIKAQPDAQLNPACKSRFMEIGAHIQSNNSRLAAYTAQLFVRDFGTHYITSVDIGAILAQEDSVKETFSSDYNLRKSEMKAAASASFFGKIGISAGYGNSASEETKKSYSHNLASSRVKTIGGPGFKVNFTVNDWEDGLDNNLVPIDRSGDPIFYVITHATLPEVPDPLRREIVQYVKEAVDEYYKFNTYKGCTNRESPNFSYIANIEDGSCKHPLSNYTFGGVYQTCSLKSGSDSSLCNKLSQKNPLTGDFHCPSEYTAVHLVSGTQRSTVKKYECRQHRRSCGFLWLKKCCDNRCTNNYYSSEASYSGYWCAAIKPVPQDTGYMFGGLYTTTRTNIMTQSFSCPPHFYPLHLGEDMNVCVGDDYELGGIYQLPFAGLFSCQAGNPLSLHEMPTQKVNKRSLSSFLQSSATSDWPHRCPHGYTQHLADMDNSCEINFCVKANILATQSTTRVIRPPFERAPEKNPNSTSILFIIGPSGKGWIRNESTSSWKSVYIAPLTKLEPSDSDLLSAISDDDRPKGGLGKSGVATAIGITFGATVFVVLISLSIALAVRRKCRQKKSISSGSRDNAYGTLGETTSEAGVC